MWCKLFTSALLPLLKMNSSVNWKWTEMGSVWIPRGTETRSLCISVTASDFSHIWLPFLDEPHVQQDRLESLLEVMGVEWKSKREGEREGWGVIIAFSIFFVMLQSQRQKVPCNLSFWNHSLTLETTRTHPKTLALNVQWLFFFFLVLQCSHCCGAEAWRSALSLKTNQPVCVWSVCVHASTFRLCRAHCLRVQRLFFSFLIWSLFAFSPRMKDGGFVLASPQVRALSFLSNCNH